MEIGEVSDEGRHKIPLTIVIHKSMDINKSAKSNRHSAFRYLQVPPPYELNGPHCEPVQRL
ncbi:uncharacterized protein G2W53_011768 [Senna tora]|uniref:Uncharacterized protein n=1 Tax=Senna tora TaxID=362788 RepID=A0A835CBL0_9FABA|nr:uncharacterized protein G2W53_011768 [Senna tora]